MSFRHVVMFTWTDDAPGDQSERVRAGLDALPALIPEIRSYVHGTDVGESDGAFDYALVADFDDIEAFRVYRDHPKHVEFINAVITGNVAARAAVQYLT